MVVNFYLRYLFNNRWIEKPKDLRNSLWPRLHRSTTTQVDSKQSRLGISDLDLTQYTTYVHRIQPEAERGLARPRRDIQINRYLFLRKFVNTAVTCDCLSTIFLIYSTRFETQLLSRSFTFPWKFLYSLYLTR